jgi:hypothetical protein
LLPASAEAKGVAGISPTGEKGWLHTVERGDTLWDITAQYLGSPWIWPSVWRDNEIENPHRISPGDLIWITEHGIKKLTAEEASRIAPLSEESVPAAEGEGAALPAAADQTRPSGEDDPFAALDRTSGDLQTKLHFPGLHRFGLVSANAMEGTAAILGSHDEAYWTSQERRTIVGVGEGKVHVGDRFTIFRTRKRIDHPETGHSLGYLVERLGTAEVMEIHTESSFVKVTSAYAEIEPGDRLMPYEEEPIDFVAVPVAKPMNGMVVGVQLYRQFALRGDIVILDHGSDDGMQRGNRFQLFRSGKEVVDPVTRAKTLVPDDLIGEAMVVKVTETASLALLTRADRPVHEGDHFRTR